MKFGFRIRTRHGLVVEHLMIHGRDEADAERKLRQIYQHCEILECSVMQPKFSPTAGKTVEEIVSPIS